MVFLVTPWHFYFSETVFIIGALLFQNRYVYKFSMKALTLDFLLNFGCHTLTLFISDIGTKSLYKGKHRQILTYFGFLVAGATLQTPLFVYLSICVSICPSQFFLKVSTKPLMRLGWRQVDVQWGTNSCTYGHWVYNVVQLGPCPFSKVAQLPQLLLENHTN